MTKQTIRSNCATSVNTVTLSSMNSRLKAPFSVGRWFQPQRHTSPKHWLAAKCQTGGDWQPFPLQSGSAFQSPCPALLPSKLHLAAGICTGTTHTCRHRPSGSLSDGHAQGILRTKMPDTFRSNNPIRQNCHKNQNVGFATANP